MLDNDNDEGLIGGMWAGMLDVMPGPGWVEIPLAVLCLLAALLILAVGMVKGGR